MKTNISQIDDLRWGYQVKHMAMSSTKNLVQRSNCDIAQYSPFPWLIEL